MITDKEKHERVLSMFTAPDGEEVGMYKTLSILEKDKNHNWSIQLGYGYKDDKKHIKYSKGVEFETIDIAVEVMVLLDRFKVRNKVVDSLDDLFAEDAPERTDAVKKFGNRSIPQEDSSPFDSRGNKDD